MSSGKEAVEQLELESCRLEGNEHMDLCLMNQLIHSLLVGISHQRDVGIGGDGFSQCGRGIHPCNDTAIGQFRKNLLHQIAYGSLVLHHGELAVIKDVIRLAGKGRDSFVGMETGHELHFQLWKGLLQVV